jgi:predicted O-methyltransferase YrrM
MALNFNEGGEVRLLLRRVIRATDAYNKNGNGLHVAFTPPFRGAKIKNHHKAVAQLADETKARSWFNVKYDREAADTLLEKLKDTQNISAAEEYVLYHTIAQSTGAKRIIETGAGLGKSGVAYCLGMGDNAERFLTFEISDRAKEVAAYYEMHNVSGIAEVRQEPSQSGLLNVNEAFDLAFVDGEHSFVGCLLDTLLTGRLLPSEGFIVIQDAISHRIAAAPEVEECILSMVESGWCEAVWINTSTGLVIMRKTLNWPEISIDKLAEWVDDYMGLLKFYRRIYREFIEARDVRYLADHIMKELGGTRILIPD